jgi:CYTH domain-containing protein
MEIERKFLVDELPDELADQPGEAIDQGYLAIGEDGVEVRVRRYRGATTLTVKSDGGLVRVEEEIDVSESCLRSLWPLTEPRRIHKRRHRIPTEDGLKIELDVYGGALEGLVVAEVEFDSERASEAFVPPRWLGREVTEDAGYKDKALAVR